jgi:hypothetical protein
MTGSGDRGAPNTARGVIPEGMWVLNAARSRKLRPGAHVLWIVHDDGDRLAWVSVETDPEGAVTLSTWQGNYNGESVEVTGTGMMALIRSSRRGEMVISGLVPDLGEFVERAEVVDDGRRLLCHGEIITADGLLTYVEDFDWVSAGPA